MEWENGKITNHYEVYISKKDSIAQDYSAYKKDGVWVVKDAAEALDILMNELDELRKSTKKITGEINEAGEVVLTSTYSISISRITLGVNCSTKIDLDGK